jgi:hypothetical protein
LAPLWKLFSLVFVQILFDWDERLFDRLLFSVKNFNCCSTVVPDVVDDLHISVSEKVQLKVNAVVA